MPYVTELLKWGPVFFGLTLFAPMLTAALNAANITLPYDVANLPAALLLGFIWGLAAKYRGSWL